MENTLSDLNFFSQNEINLLVEAKKNKNYIHIKPNSSEIKQVMNLQKLNEMMSRHDSWNVSNFKLVLDRKPIDFHKISTPGVDLGFNKVCPDPEKVQNYIRKGASLVLNDIIYLSQNVRKFATDLQKITLGKCQANLYFSMQSHQAFGPHYDTHDVFALHCAGEKTWNVYEALEDNPINHPIFKKDTEERTKMAGKVIDQVHMEPGDLLYLPRGKFHDALASKSGAVHIAFGITYMKPLDIMQFIWEEFIINSYLRSDIREIKNKNQISEINKNISQQLGKIFADEKLLQPILEYYNNWPYKLTEYDIESVVKQGVQYEISNLISLERQNEKILLSNAANSVEVPKKFEHLVEFSFEQKFISIKKIKEKFQEIPDKEIKEFVDSMKQMKVFI